MDYLKFNELIESIYQSAIDPESWEETLLLLNKYFNSNATGIFVSNNNALMSTQIPFLGVSEEALSSYNKDYALLNPTFAELEDLLPGHFFSEQLFNQLNQDSDYYHNTAFYNEWMKPQNFDHTSGGVLIAEKNNLVCFTQMRSFEQGKYSDQEILLQKTLSRHICRALEMSSMFQKLEYKSSCSNLLIKNIGLGVAIISKQGDLIEMNETARDSFDRCKSLFIHNGRITAKLAEDRDKLCKSLEQIQLLRVSNKELPVNLKLTDANNFFINLLPLPIQELPLFNDAAAIVIIKNSTAPTPIKLTHLTSSYSLTNSEARLAQQLAEGTELKNAARIIGVSYETARWYLKSIFEKTDTHRQTELVLKLNSDPVGKV
ncbi:helix-turn-helix transcriptional regulator [Neptuniibacter sp. QD48_11]|uniref:helix-turn-helix transcriptional regulator n=1 Tax=unclassified Neptuniibacter TaxID=2630693 RepID=UPI0039F5FF2D